MSESNLDPNVTRVEILRKIINSDAGLTLTEISRKMKIPFQNIRYHLPFLEEAGLIFRDGDVYVAQPIFANEFFIDLCEKNISEIFTKAIRPEDYFFESDKMQDKEAIIKNCARAAIILEMMQFEPEIKIKE